MAKPNRIKEVIEAKGYKPRNVSRRAGISINTLYSWMNSGTPEKVVDFVKLSKVLGLSVEELMGDTSVPIKIDPVETTSLQSKRVDLVRITKELIQIIKDTETL